MAGPSWWQRLLAFLFPGDPDEGSDPAEVFNEAIRRSRQKFLDVKATAAPLYAARDSLRAQESGQREEIVRLKDRTVELLRDKQEKEALDLAARQGRLEADLERTRAELTELEKPVARVEEQLRRIEAEVRDLERERDRSTSAVKAADARIAVDRILAVRVDDREIAALAEARESVQGRVAQARALEELSQDEEARFEQLGNDEEAKAARARLEALKATLQIGPGDGEGGK